MQLHYIDMANRKATHTPKPTKEPSLILKTALALIYNTQQNLVFLGVDVPERKDHKVMSSMYPFFLVLKTFSLGLGVGLVKMKASEIRLSFIIQSLNYD